MSMTVEYTVYETEHNGSMRLTHPVAVYDADDAEVMFEHWEPEFLDGTHMYVVGLVVEHA